MASRMFIPHKPGAKVGTVQRPFIYWNSEPVIDDLSAIIGPLEFKAAKMLKRKTKANIKRLGLYDSGDLYKSVRIRPSNIPNGGYSVIAGNDPGMGKADYAMSVETGHAIFVKKRGYIATRRVGEKHKFKLGGYYAGFVSGKPYLRPASAAVKKWFRKTLKMRLSQALGRQIKTRGTKKSMLEIQ